jgi:hypothetical protein
MWFMEIIAVYSENLTEPANISCELNADELMNNIFIYSLYATLFYIKNLCFIKEHYMFRHISTIIRCCQFSILTLSIL